MNDYVIFSDSTTDLSPALIQEIGVEIIPLSFLLGGKAYLNYPDERDLSSKEFYRRIRQGESSTTNQLNSVQFVEAFEPVLQAGKDVFYMAFSSGLSGTYNNACMAAEELSAQYPQQKVIVVDTLAASMGEGLLVYLAAEKKKEGLSIEELKTWVETHRNKLAHWFTVDDLNHLKRGGRVSGAAAFFGTVLGIKPVLHVDDEGHLIPMEKVRGRRQSLDALVAHMKKSAEHPEGQTICISHGDAQEDAQYVAEKIREAFPVKQIYIHTIGPVIGAHSGPGTIALFYLAKDKN